MKRFIISGTNSGCGKTTITCAILQALVDRKLKTAAFKCGPDYIDPMLHSRITSGNSHNLDSFFCNDDTLNYILDSRSESADIAVIEGVMGFYDGSKGSAYSISEITETPVVLIIDCKGMQDSIGAVMQGFLNYKSNRISGFIFNRLPEKLIPFAKELCRENNTNYYGCFPTNSVKFESRHLGLVTAGEISDFDEKMHQLSELAEKYICLDELINIADTPVPACKKPEIPRLFDENAPVIAVAKDSAFCFIYNENIEFLQELGCKIEYFSPLEDEFIPKNANGLILSGGYPELYAEKLAANRSMLADIKMHIETGMPCIAECGGFLYLHEYLENADKKRYGMVGLFRGLCERSPKLQNFGYITMKAELDNLLCDKGESFPAHEFHYWKSPDMGSAFSAYKNNGKVWECGHVSDSFYAGFPHIYFCSVPETAIRFARKCNEYSKRSDRGK